MSVTGTADRLRAHLATLSGGVGCRHLARERDGVSAGLLVDLGLVRPIVSRVPRCVDHACPWQDGCAHWEDFEPGVSGAKAGVKYRLTVDGEATAADAPRITDAVLALSAAREILTLLKAGPATIFTLNTHFLERARQAARAGENPDVVSISRVTLDAVLRMLVELDLVTCSEDGVTYEERGARNGD